MDTCYTLDGLNNVLRGFISSKKIESDKSSSEIKPLENAIRTEQFNIISKNRFGEEENILFNALRNIRLLFTEMKEQLINAQKIGENPSTAERCITVMPFVEDINNMVCGYSKNPNDTIIRDIERKTRILRRKMKENNLLFSIESELNDVALKPKEFKEAIDNYNNIIIQDI